MSFYFFKGFNVLSLLIILSLLYSFNSIYADDLDEFKLKTEQVFEFTEKPIFIKEKNGIKIKFKSKGYCDVTISIYDNNGKLIRHLASGILGKNAPLPFKSNALAQSIHWDLKDDAGRYVKNYSDYKINVSLGLKPQFEKTLYWSPKRRMGNSKGPAVIKVIKEGVLVADGKGVDRLTLYDHDGEYIKMIYPFPNNQIKKVKGLNWKSVPQGGQYPMKHSLLKQTLLTSGDNSGAEKHNSMDSNAITSLAANGDKLALIKKKLNRVLLNGSTGEFDLEGSPTSHYQAKNRNPAFGKPIYDIFPSSSAFSPDGKWIYMSGYIHHIGEIRNIGSINCLHGVTRIPYATKGKLEVFMGKMTKITGRGYNMKDAGTDNKSFTCATSVACDKAGRIYVSDYMNHRIQIYSSDKKLLKTIKTKFPAKVQIHPITEEIYVLSYIVLNPHFNAQMHKSFKQTLTIYNKFDNASKIKRYPLPITNIPQGMSFGVATKGNPYSIELDLFSKKLRLWVSTGLVARHKKVAWENKYIKIYELTKNKFKTINSFGKIVEKEIGRKKLPDVFSQVQYPYVNPYTGFLYIAEPARGQNFDELLEINPNTNAMKVINLPFTTTDIAFDYSNNIYLRSKDILVRYDFNTWKEVPWDYGTQLKHIEVEAFGRSTSVISGLRLPSINTNQTHQGGMSISRKGNLIVSCVNAATQTRGPHYRRKTNVAKLDTKNYSLSLHAGRLANESLHMWDKHGKILHKDVAPGLGRLDGVWIDNNNKIFVMSVLHRMLDGKKYYNNRGETLMKLTPNKSKFVSSSKRLDYVPLQLNKNNHPKKPHDLYGLGNVWTEGVSWFYGGVGFAGKNTGGDAESGCCCWHSNFVIDGFSRSFAPVVDQYRVDILDSNGNLIYKLGKYGNVDDGLPLNKKGGPKSPISIGGDEVSLFHACYVATDSNNRIFIVDIGNGRVVSVKIGYQKTEVINLE
ncbi:MAG: hypothetical protein COA79_17305 [Planctomycetota bacterium]|nr:MAG: hypothetical protein COA79_17305 [Planctomycetota bacterium]